MVKGEQTMTTNTTTDLNEFTLSDQAVGTVMMALQKSLMEQSDIVPTLKGFRLTTAGDNTLVVVNPPLVKLSHEDTQTLAAAGNTTDTETE